MASLSADVGALREQVSQAGEALSALGSAIAPIEGLTTAPLRLAELRDQVNALSRNVRRLALTQAGRHTDSASQPAAPS